MLHILYTNVMGPRTFYRAKLQIFRLFFAKNFGLTIFTSGVFRCSIPCQVLDQNARIDSPEFLARAGW